jgi:NADH-quinone oxidoreductase subunit C
MSELLDRVRRCLGADLLDSHEKLGDTSVTVPRERVAALLERMRDDASLGLNFLMDLTVVDYLGRDPRFEVVYHLASVDTAVGGSEPARLRHRLRVKAGVPEVPCECPSAAGVYAAANWMEREAFDLYGVRFSGHPDLRRLLLYEQFKGHPLRKDYPKERRQPLVGPRN